MSGSLWQAAQSLHQFFPSQQARFGNASSGDQFGQFRGAGHGGDASLGEKPYFLDAAVPYAGCELENIAAGGVLNLGRGVRIRHFARVTRVFEVIEDLWRIHRENFIVPCTVFERAE